MDAKKIIRNLKKTLSACTEVQFAYLHGSFLDRQDPKDIDVALFLKKPTSRLAIMSKIADKLEKSLQYKYQVDLQQLNNASPAFRFRVISKNKILLDRSKDARLNWEAHTLSAYQDMKPMLDFYDRAFLKS